MTDPSPPADAERNERTLLFITSLGHALCHMGELLFTGVTLAVMAEYGLAPHVATALALVGYILLGAGALPMGAWADARGPGRVLQIYFFLMAAASLAVAGSSTVWQLFVALTALGLAASIYHPAALTLLSLGMRQRGRAMGINGVVGSVGQALGPWLGAKAAHLGMWRMAYVVLAVLALVGGGLMFLARRRLAGLDGARPLSASQDTAPPPPAAPLRSWLPLGLLLGAMLLGGFNYRCLATALPPFFDGDGDRVFWILLLGGCCGQLLGGWAADRFGNRVYPTFIGLLMPCAVLLAWSEGMPVSLGVALLLAVFLFSQQPVENLLLAEWSDRRRYSQSYGAKFALTFGFGALGAGVTGVVRTATGSWGAIFYFLAGTGCVMVLLYFAALRCQRRERVEPQPILIPDETNGLVPLPEGPLDLAAVLRRSR